MATGRSCTPVAHCKPAALGAWMSSQARKRHAHHRPPPDADGLWWLSSKHERRQAMRLVVLLPGLTALLAGLEVSPQSNLSVGFCQTFAMLAVMLR